MRFALLYAGAGRLSLLSVDGDAEAYAQTHARLAEEITSRITGSNLSSPAGLRRFALAATTLMRTRVGCAKALITAMRFDASGREIEEV